MKNTPGSQFSNAKALAFLRISVGILFLIFGQYKVFGTQFTLHGGFQFWINKFLQERLPVHGSGASRFCAAPCRGNRVSGGVWRISHRSGSGARLTGPSRKRLWIALYAFLTVFLKLSGRTRSALAILRCFAGSFRTGAVLLRISDRRFRYSVVVARMVRPTSAQAL